MYLWLWLVVALVQSDCKILWSSIPLGKSNWSRSFYVRRWSSRQVSIWDYYFVKSVRIRSHSGPQFPAFGLNTEKYSVSLHILSKCGKKRTGIILNADAFLAVYNVSLVIARMLESLAGCLMKLCASNFYWIFFSFRLSLIF